jgi:hypothetical protein
MVVVIVVVVVVVVVLVVIVVVVVVVVVESLCTWNVKAKVIPKIIGASGTILKSFRKYLSNTPGQDAVEELQQTAILGTAHVLFGKY